MAGYLKKVDVEKMPVQAINQKVSSEILEEFQKKLKERNLMMNTVIEAFCRQYANGQYRLKKKDILKWKNYNGKVSILNTPVNKEVYNNFRAVVKDEGYFIKNVLAAFLEDYTNTNKILKLVDEHK